jgi:thiamine biosynthesis lipoprotein ApbE
VNPIFLLNDIDWGEPPELMFEISESGTPKLSYGSFDITIEPVVSFYRVLRLSSEMADASYKL